VSEPHSKSKISSLRSWYLSRLSKSSKWFVAYIKQNKLKMPTTLQEIPPLAKDMLEFMNYPDPDDTYLTTKGEEKTYKEANPAKEIIQMSLELAKELNLLHSGMDLPLRRIWYAFVKASLERGLKDYVYSKASEEKAGEQREATDSDYYDGFSDIIKSSSDLWYDVYGIKNTGKMTFVPTGGEDTWGNKIVSLGDMFTPIMLGVEKTSYFQVLENMCKMLGLSLYAAGGQSSVSASEEIMRRIDPIMKEKKQKHMDIYAITDFDPAGYSIAKGIHKHSKLFIERYGGTVDFERIAPLPIHYTDIELQQGLYTVKKKWTEPTTKTFKRGKKKGQTETKGHWGYNPTDRKRDVPDNVLLGAIDVIEEREAEGKITFERKRVEYATKSKKGAKHQHEKGDPILNKDGDEQFYISQGLEIESLPEEPIEEILKNPPTSMPSDYSGIARMRYIIFDDIIERHGLLGAFKFLIGLKKRTGSTYSGEKLAENVVDVENAEKIDSVVNDADTPFWQLHTDMEEWIKSYIKDEKNEVAKDIDDWLDDVIQKYTNPSHELFNEEKTEKLKNELKDKIYRALARNESSISFNFPESFSIDKIKHYRQMEEDFYKDTSINESDYSYSADFKITIPDDIIENIEPIADFAKCIALNAQEVVDYLEELKGKLEEGEHIFDRKWEIPPVRACIINDDGEAEFSEEGEIIEGDCGKYKTEIRKLHDSISDLEGDIIKLEKKVEEAKENGDTVNCDEYTDEIYNLENKIIELKQEIERKSERYEDQIHDLNRQVIDCEKYKKEISRLNELVAEYKELGGKDVDCTKFKTEIRRLHDVIADYEKDILELEKSFGTPAWG